MTEQEKAPWKKLSDDADKRHVATASVRSTKAKPKPTAAARTRKPTKTVNKVICSWIHMNTMWLWLASYVTVTLMTFGKPSNGRRVEVES